MGRAGRHALVAQVAVQRGLADIEVARDLAYAQLAFAVDRLGGDGFPFGLVRESIRASPEPSPGLGCVQAGLRTLPDQVALKLGEGGGYVEDEPTLTAGDVNGVVQALEGHAFFHELLNEHDQMFEGASEPVEFPDDDVVAFAHLRQQSAKFHAFGFCAADLFMEDLLAVLLLERIELEIQVLVPG